jgi:hypothetical protein
LNQRINLDEFEKGSNCEHLAQERLRRRARAHSGGMIAAEQREAINSALVIAGEHRCYTREQ